MKKAIVFSAVLLALSFAGCGSNPPQQPSGGSSPQLSSESEASLEKVESVNSPVWGVGTYLVGKDLPAGLYRATLEPGAMGMGYIERASDVKMEVDSIIANIVLTGNGYVTVKDTDVAVKLSSVTLEAVDLQALTPDLKAEVSDGIYLVGYDIAPGTYMVEVTDTTTGMAYIERMSDASMDADAILANDIVEGQGYVEVVETDFALKIQGAKLTLQ